MDWFERLTGFREAGYCETQSLLEASDGRLRSAVNGKSYGVGEFELPSLGELRERLAQGTGPRGRLRFSNVVGDVGALHQVPEYAGALVQVASQFNMLEMISPAVTPEDGVMRYASDHTQGPSCAMAAGAATIFRNYLVKVDGELGQTAARQLDGLADLGAALADATGLAVHELWTMRNGYALCTSAGLTAISAHLQNLEDASIDDLRARLRIGVHRKVEVTDGPRPGFHVSQAFCSALPVAYCGLPRAPWRPFASLVLEAAYEATLIEAVLAARSGGSNIVLLTRLGGGVFGNDDRWIDAALTRALRLFDLFDLDVRLVSFGAVPKAMAELEVVYTNQNA